MQAYAGTSIAPAARVTTLWFLMMWLVTYTSAQTLKYEILEELPQNTLIGNIPFDARMDTVYNASELAKLRFSFYSMPSGVTDDMFQVEEHSGLLKSVGRVDREGLCPRQPVCELVFFIAVRPMQYMQIVKVVMNILDVNDNHPKFPEPMIVLNISESTLPGTNFIIPSAEDPDSGNHSIQDYKMVLDQYKFQLQVRETTNGSTDLRLVLMSTLDRETKDSYEIQIIASDGGKPSKSGSIIINVFVLDANDLNLAFDNSSYDVTVKETSHPGSPVLTVSASYPVQGLNGRIEYAFSRRTELEYGDLFWINNETGVIYVKAELDYEQAYIYSLTVTAQDKSSDSSPAKAKVVVRIEDVNDNAPQITVNALTDTGKVSVTENSPPGTFMAHISVFDPDSNENGKVMCTIDNDNFLLEQLSSTQYKIITAAIFDREQVTNYQLKIHCVDNGNPALSSIAQMTIYVIDQNDNTPEFSQQFYYAIITENNRIGEHILTVTATDNDALGRNSEVEYSIADDTSSFVNIDPKTGWIKANVVFDREIMEVMDFHVLAKDFGDEVRRSSTATVLLTVLDVDDNKPEFQQASYEFSIFENEPKGN